MANNITRRSFLGSVAMEQIAEAVRKIQRHAGELAAKMKEGVKEV